MHLLGADPSHPCVMYHMARSLNADCDVKCVDSSYPKDISVVSSVDIEDSCSLKARSIGEFDGDVERTILLVFCYKLETLMHVEGSYFVRDGTVSRMQAPQTIFVVSELTHEQWLYLGYFQYKNSGLSIAVLEGVDVPKECVLTSQTVFVNFETSRRVWNSTGNSRSR